MIRFTKKKGVQPICLHTKGIVHLYFFAWNMKIYEKYWV